MNYLLDTDICIYWMKNINLVRDKVENVKDLPLWYNITCGDWGVSWLRLQELIDLIIF